MTTQTNQPTIIDSDNVLKLCEEYQNATGKTVPSDIVSHESAHYQKALELGYVPRIRVRFGKYVFTKFEVYFDRPVKPEHLIQILLAPKDPSFDDEFLAKRKMKEIEEEKLNSLEAGVSK